jgi:hypothetical protein
MVVDDPLQGTINRPFTLYPCLTVAIYIVVLKGDVDQNIALNSKNVPYKGDPPIQTVFDFR